MTVGVSNLMCHHCKTAPATCFDWMYLLGERRERRGWCEDCLSKRHPASAGPLPGHKSRVDISNGNPKTLEEAIALVGALALGVMQEKRRLRGHKNITRQGLYGVVTRVTEDKMARIQRSVETLDLRERLAGRAVPQSIINELVPLEGREEESLEDDLVDSMNYFTICLLLRYGWWSLPLAEEIKEERG